MRWMTFIACGFGLLLTSLAGVARAEPVVVERESALRAEPSLTASTIATVPRGARGTVTGRSGVWVNINTPEGSGWVFTFNVRFGERSAADAVASGRGTAVRAKPGVVSTIGIRGLSEEDLQRASFNANEMRRLDAYAASPEAAAQRASAAGLSAYSIDYLEAK